MIQLTERNFVFAQGTEPAKVILVWCLLGFGICPSFLEV